MTVVCRFCTNIRNGSLFDRKVKYNQGSVNQKRTVNNNTPDS